ncbi:hypothetical protein [Geminocystis sp. NIES-3709]|uniref:hypothetical protein n=1 Tax=Geminocystis sp. NIES-3709 TaxID=1617448 RepID=UPI0005FC41AA|nr:hypothetical protein [Geminocystis sp. NIES-3709]BAQ65568.1 hypothetical protein GM3709_2333 [Geminocystis sp. NIES-3709]
MDEINITYRQNEVLQVFLKHQDKFNYLELCAEELKIQTTLVTQFLRRLKEKKVLIKLGHGKYKLNQIPYNIISEAQSKGPKNRRNKEIESAIEPSKQSQKSKEKVEGNYRIQSPSEPVKSVEFVGNKITKIPLPKYK